ncbi:MAG: efflux RND transporter periplasmic adaptor subunit [Treponema sp.]|jgi:HlyD family secretion protein|nr:efflux RND transporter periplasmic adaptor subunit [Treponema sp.]
MRKKAVRPRPCGLPFGLLFFLIAGTLIWAGCGRALKGGKGAYEFVPVSRGTIEKTVASSGSLNPVSTVKILPRMSGKVEKINVDYNDIVRRGDIIAALNTDMLRLQREQHLAQVIKSRANYELQLINYRNLEALEEKSLISEYELKTGKTTLEIQRAELSAAEANLKVIETEINQYAFITSPIDGIVLERNINEGDTVVDSSSSNSTSIFTLAENLEEMQIESWVGELDIASIYQGQPVRFTLESLPGRFFTGTVKSKRLMPSVQDNVVSYNVIINVENREGALLPGMTCAVEFIEEQRENILLVPNAALRYQPEGLNPAQGAGAENAGTNAGPVSGGQAPGGITQLLQGGMPGAGRMRPPDGGGVPQPGASGRRQAGAGSGAETGERRSQPASRPRSLWYIGENGGPEAVLVRTGISDGVNTEIIPLEEGSVTEGMRIILREQVR